MEQRVAEEKQRVAEEKQRAAEEKQRAAEEKQRAAEADQRAAEEKQRAETNAQGVFFALMNGMAAHASCSRARGSDSDQPRQAVPATVTVPALVEKLFRSCAALEVRKRWKAYRAFHINWTPPEAPARERSHVHPVVQALLRSAMPEKGELKLHFEEKVSDSLGVDEEIPDVTIADSRDALPSVVRACGKIEIKNAALSPDVPSNLLAAAQQSRNYARRSVARRMVEAFDRGDDCSKIQVLAVGTDGRRVVFSCVRSGAPPLGASYQGCVPCPSEQSLELGLLEGWDFVTQWEPPQDPPLGFEALCRMLSTPAAQLRGGAEEDLRSVRVVWEVRHPQPGIAGASAGAAAGAAVGAAAGAAVGAAAGAAVGAAAGAAGGAAAGFVPPTDVVDVLELGDRLGSGGFSDVYKVTGAAALANAAGGDLRTAVAKLPRAATAASSKMFTTEAATLRIFDDESVALHSVRGHLPELVASGRRCMDNVPLAAVLRSEASQRVAWPVLIMRPEGQALQQRLLELSRQSGSTARSAKRTLADAAARHVLTALQFVHGLNIVHADIRPDNIVWAGDKAVLVDW
jgi:hypothetical protein